MYMKDGIRNSFLNILPPNFNEGDARQRIFLLSRFTIPEINPRITKRLKLMKYFGFFSGSICVKIGLGLTVERA